MKIRYYNYGKKKDKITNEWKTIDEFDEWMFKQPEKIRARFSISLENGAKATFDVNGDRDGIRNDIVAFIERMRNKEVG